MEPGIEIPTEPPSEPPDVFLNGDPNPLPPLRRPISKTRSEWTRKEMLLFGGTSWFYIFIGFYVLQSAGSLVAEVQPGGDLVDIDIRLVWVALMCLTLGGAGMLAGLFCRPSWRGLRWAVLVGLSLIGQILYSEFYRAAWSAGHLSWPVWADEASFVFWLAVGFCRSMLDWFASRGGGK